MDERGDRREVQGGTAEPAAEGPQELPYPSQLRRRLRRPDQARGRLRLPIRWEAESLELLRENPKRP